MIHLKQGMLGTQLNDLVRSQNLQKGSVVQLNLFICNVIQNRRSLEINLLDNCVPTKTVINLSSCESLFHFIPSKTKNKISPNTNSMLFRKLCISLPRSNCTSFFFNQTLPSNFRPNPQIFRFEKALKSISPCSISQTRRFHFSDSSMSDAKRPAAVPIPSPDFADRAELYRALEASLGSSFSSEPFIPNPHPLIVVISGPSGAGKDAVINRLRQARENLHFVVTATSRGKRPGEIDGKDYFFVGKEEFLGMIERNELLEYALVYGDYKGVPKQQIRDYMSKGCDIVLRVDIQGAATLRKIMGKSAVFVFLVAESEEALVKRLINRRTETKETLLVRIATAKEEIKHIRDFDYVVVNKEGELDSAVSLVESIIDAEKAKVNQRNAVI